jgi:glyoxylase-like metal-dependent hydrolase (beta-lactamase superfamily II)
MKELAGSDRSAPPGDSQVEVSVFGPGQGECLVLHLGMGEWAVVDSHRSAETGAPVALAYLKALGVSVAEQVRLIVATHWHDDHMDGLAELFSHCETAKFVCSMAMQSAELKNAR